jgi:hypothetical protein
MVKFAFLLFCCFAFALDLVCGGIQERSALYQETLRVMNIPGEDYANYISGLRWGQCSVFKENGGEILRVLLSHKRYDILKNIFERQCTIDRSLITTTTQVIVDARDIVALDTFLHVNFFTTPMLRYSHRQYIFSKCAISKFYAGVQLFDKEICRIVNSARHNILHMAAALADNVLFDMAARCNRLINQKDKAGKYPMDYAANSAIANRLNDKWLQVARHQFLNLESCERRYLLCSTFDIPERGENVSRGEMLQESFIEGFNDPQALFCPYLKMKVNILEYPQHSLPTQLMEWLSLLLTDIFQPGKPDGTVEKFSLPLFEYSEAAEGFVPNGLYPKEVYGLAGKIVRIANHFELGLSTQVKITGNENEATKSLLAAFFAGKDSLNLIRFEAHKNTYYLENFIIKVGSKVIEVEMTNTTSYVTMHHDAYMFIKAFSQLSDRHKLLMIESIMGKSKINRMYIRFTEIPSGPNGFHIERDQNELFIATSPTIEGFNSTIKKGLFQ